MSDCGPRCNGDASILGGAYRAVHDVAEMAQVARVADCLLDAKCRKFSLANARPHPLEILHRILPFIGFCQGNKMFKPDYISLVAVA